VLQVFLLMIHTLRFASFKQAAIVPYFVRVCWKMINLVVPPNSIQQESW
jgi:hypothetical protein